MRGFLGRTYVLLEYVGVVAVLGAQLYVIGRFVAPWINEHVTYGRTGAGLTVVCVLLVLITTVVVHMRYDNRLDSYWLESPSCNRLALWVVSPWLLFAAIAAVLIAILITILSAITWWLLGETVWGMLFDRMAGW